MLNREVDADGVPFPTLPLPWYERGTPVSTDTTIALEYLHCTLPEFYQRTTPQERLYYRLYFASKAARQEFADVAARQEQEWRAHLDTRQGLRHG